ncbi:pyruvate/2-oxoglutarate dehydrogenase complex, dihydrolipoamide dehydrogenase component [Desulfocapsa sulfexigens DSM 10523]|uniref:Pyruvate/2-oxoglutarate dehydrogenase complex, dihydrolipoamide dehydrogenase component n=1 Tax=Desulfocapsa sulfexigens (strain DSM 10523 / SB164P1) TaxID=1167006 RepID=M1P8B4_DESSD|nr:FAD-dependent oxidoreductase [Desulfocapsa sulfexigens]AGF77907.1 pyruvate/2-oxoglutarate dehydrogenase complex, dihydrolipoamide dehydrogenase component [Desulfocapsa sulfexigens DSM 10523]
MTKYDYDIAVIGGGAAGLTVSAGAAQLGAKTLIIEKESALGGDCLHYGCVPSKTLVKSAHVYHTMQRATDFGLPGIELPPVDFTKVAARIKSVIEKIQVHDSVERFCKLGAKVEFGAPRFVDEHAVELNGKRVSAKHWVVATGSSSSTPPFPGLESTPYITNKEIFSLASLPKSLIVLGAGPIAVEMAQAFSRLGSEVTVIQRSDQILSKEDKDMADIAMVAMKDEGVRFYLGASIKQIKDLGNERQVEITDANGEDVTLKASTLLVALGRQPNIEGLGLEEIGVEMTRKGIVVDNRIRTNHSHIYAPGDINGAYQFTHAAGYEGGIVVSNAIFHLPRKADYTWMPWATYCDPELASIGMNEKAAKAAGIDYQIWTENFADNDRALAEDEGRGRIKMILDASEKPLGVQIVGPRAGDLLGEWIAILNGKVKLSTLAGAIHPYPTLVEINKRVAGTYFSPKIFSPTIKKGLKFFFNLKGAACDPSSDIR